MTARGCPQAATGVGRLLFESEPRASSSRQRPVKVHKRRTCDVPAIGSSPRLIAGLHHRQGYDVSNKPWDAWYTSTRWRRRRRHQLQRRPLCQWCEKRGHITVATIAHHIEPHKGDPGKFWFGELVSLCKDCHDVDAQRIERGGKPRQQVGADGWPIDRQ